MSKYAYQFRLVVIGAQDLFDMSTLGKLDTFAEISYNSENYKSSTLHNCGKNPTWNFELSLSGNSNIIKIGVYDKRILKEKLIGECIIDFNTIRDCDQTLITNLTNTSRPDQIMGKLRLVLSLNRQLGQFNSKSAMHYIAPIAPSDVTCIPTPHVPYFTVIQPSSRVQHIVQPPRTTPNYISASGPHSVSAVNPSFNPSVTGMGRTNPGLRQSTGDNSNILRDYPQHSNTYGIPKSSSQTSLHNTGDSPCYYQQPKARPPFHQPDSMHSRRPVLNNAKMYPIIPIREN